MVIEHEPWCDPEAHNNELGEELCVSNYYDFGSGKEENRSLAAGYVYASRAESDEDAHVIVYFPNSQSSIGSMSPGAVHQIVAALEHDPAQLLTALRELATDLSRATSLSQEDS